MRRDPESGVSALAAMIDPATTNGSDPRMAGGAILPGALTYAAAEPLNAWTTTVKARVLRGTEWSALNEAEFFRSSPPPLAITEILSEPAPPTPVEAAAGFTDKDDFEFIELMNTGTEPLNLRDIRFARGVDITFSDVTLAAGERAVVVRRLTAFRQRYGSGPRVIGTFALNFDDGGERLALTSASGAILTDFSIDIAAPWPAGPAGSSLVLRASNLDPAGELNWRTSLVIGGSPSAGEGTTYAAWKAAHNIPDDTADPDADGMDPLLEYVTGGSPAVADTGRHPAFAVLNGAVRLSYLHALAADDVTATVMQSSDLSQWAPASVEPVSAVAATDGTEHITVRLTGPPGSRFFLTIHWQLRP